MVTWLEIVTEVIAVQFLSIYSPRVVTVFGMTSEVREVQPSKALLPMVVTEAGMTKPSSLVAF